MSTEDQEQLQREMAEAAALPVADPRRQEVMRRVQEVGAWAEDEWVALLDVDERLRVELPRVPTPAGMEERLLAIPKELSLPRRGLRRRRMFAAAALVLVCGGLLTLLLRDRDQSQQIREIGLIAISDHMSEQHLTIETSDAPTLIAALKPQVHFDIKLPQLGQGFRLLGGRRCTFDRNAVGYTRWERGGHEYSLYQFCPKDFDLPSDFPRRTVVPDDGQRGVTYDALVWTEKGCAYVLVAERGAFVPTLARAPGRTRTWSFCTQRPPPWRCTIVMTGPIHDTMALKARVQ